MDIQYSGYTAKPADYLCEDGHLEAAIDMVPSGGTLRPFKKPLALGLTLDPLTQHIFVHQTSTYTHYIIYDTSDGNIRFYYLSTLDGTEYPDDDNLFYTLEGQTIQSITAIGNIVIVSTDEQLAYFRWNTNGGYYVYIGDHVPDPNITFALNSELVKKTYSNCEYNVQDSDGEDLSNAAGGWEDVATGQVSWDVDYGDEIPEEDRTVEFSGLTIEANTYYRFVITKISGHYCGVDIYGTNSSTGEVERLDHSSGSQASFDFENADQSVSHTDIYAVFRTKTMYLSLSAIITIQKGSSFTYGKIVEYTEDSYNAMMGCLNDYVASVGTEKNRFIHPFFIRYAVRLYDGTYAYISPPALLVPNTSYAPLIFYYYNGEENPVLISYVSDLQYRMGEEILSDWDDIIDGVDFFVSQPIYPYDQSLEYDEDEDRFTYIQYNCYDDDSSNDLVNDLEGFDYTIGTVSMSGTDVSENVADKYGDTEGHLMRDLYDYIKYGGDMNLLPEDDAEAVNGHFNIVLPSRRSDDEMQKEFTSVAAYYRIKQLTMADLRNETGKAETDDEEFVTLTLEKGVLDTLATQVTLDEDNLSLYTCKGASLYSYNNRLHIFNAQTEFTPPKCLHALNTFMTSHEDDGKTSYPIYTYPIQDIWVYIKTEEGDRCAHIDGDGLYYTRDNFFWFFYPEARAYKVIIRYEMCFASRVNGRMALSTSKYVEIPLTSHDFTTGAYAFVLPTSGSNVCEADGSTVTDEFPEDTVPDSTLLRSSTIYVSEVSNPFVYTASAVVSVGAEYVYALAAAAQPLSVGQFGDFPLYAFTSEGVWAFSLEDTGVYSARQPITRDICINPENITQLDRSVLFVTDRGVMEIAGSDCNCLTDAIDNRDARFDVTTLQSIDKLLATVGTSYVSDAMTVGDMRTFMASAKIVYDYTHQRLFFSNPEQTSAGGLAYPYTYVYDIAQAQWSFVSVVVALTTNSYPEAICILNNGDVVDFAQEDTTTPIHCAALTRPMKFGAPDSHKTVRTMIQRGLFPAGVANEVDGIAPVRQVLYASNDLINWHAVASSNRHYLRNYSGTAYKYYRVLLLCYLRPGDDITGFSIEALEKRNNQIR